MKAIVYDVVGAPALVRDVAEPECPEDGAVITVRATGVCRSDWHAWRGHEAVPLPHIPGHEFAGVIAAVGAQARQIRSAVLGRPKARRIGRPVYSRL